MRALNTPSELWARAYPGSPPNGWLLTGLWSPKWYSCTQWAQDHSTQRHLANILQDFCKSGFRLGSSMKQFVNFSFQTKWIVQQESNCIIVMMLCFRLLATYLSKSTIQNWWSIAMYCCVFKVYNFDRVSLRRRWCVSDKAENDGSYLYYVVSVSISKSSTVLSQMLK